MSVDAAVGEAVCAAIREQVRRLGLDIGLEPAWADAAFSSETDPYTQAVSGVAVWKGKARYGKATFFPDGRVFAEYQVLLPHPGQPGRFVEAVQVWGQPGALKGEAVIATFPA